MKAALDCVAVIGRAGFLLVSWTKPPPRNLLYLIGVAQFAAVFIGAVSQYSFLQNLGACGHTDVCVRVLWMITLFGMNNGLSAVEGREEFYRWNLKGGEIRQVSL